MARPPKNWYTAKTSDVHDLYERSVQCPEAEVDLVDQAWHELRGRTPRTIREDFCGTGAVIREWVTRRDDNLAIGVDLDGDILDWCRGRMAKDLSDQQAGRITLVQGDVTTTDSDSVDCVLAMNFSYFAIKDRPSLVNYFQHVRGGLIDDGIFLLDAYGGSDAHLQLDEDRDLDGFTYVWDQHSYSPVTAYVVNHIHFEFPDDSSIKNAFTYRWRLWSLPEIHDALLDAGFGRVVFYWEGTDNETGEGDGIWKIDDIGEPCPGWVTYIAALR